MNMPFKGGGAKISWLNGVSRLKTQLKSLDVFRLHWTLTFQVAFVIVLFITRPTFELGSSSELLETLMNDAEVKTQFVGVDVSHYQGEINWANVVPRQDFIFIKATDGITDVDSKFHENAKSLEGFNVPSGAYHFYEPSHDPIKQADNYLKQISQYSLELRPVLDIEISSGVSVAEIAKNALAWLKHVEEKTGCQPIIYTYSDYWNQYLGKDFNDYDYWLADYNKAPTLPSSRTSWQIWQYTDRGRISGLDNVVDQNIFQGTKDEFSKLLCNSA